MTLEEVLKQAREERPTFEADRVERQALQNSENEKRDLTVLKPDDKGQVTIESQFCNINPVEKK